MGEVVQVIPRPNPNRKPLEKQAAEILSQIDTSPSELSFGAGIDGIPYWAPEKDPA